MAQNFIKKTQTRLKKHKTNSKNVSKKVSTLQTGGGNSKTGSLSISSEVEKEKSQDLFKDQAKSESSQMSEVSDMMLEEPVDEEKVHFEQMALSFFQDIQE